MVQYIGLSGLLTKREIFNNVHGEKLQVADYTPAAFSWIYSHYRRRKSIRPHEGNMQDVLIIVHDPDHPPGMVIGDEASRVRKRAAVFGMKRASAAD